MTGSQHHIRLLVGFTSLLLIVPACAQTGVPRCIRPDWNLIGPRNQSPCEVLTNALGTCSRQAGTVFNLTSVNSHPLAQYPAPESTDPVIGCKCTDTVYNLYSACAACQSSFETPNNWLPRQTWFAQCPNQSPSGIEFTNTEEVAPWMNQTYIPTFDIQRALQFQETGILPSPTTVESVTASADPSATVIAASSDSSNTGKSNKGAIVGGVVGGGIFLAAIAFFILYSIRRRRAKKRTPASAEFMKYAQGQADVRKSATTPLTHVYHPSVEEIVPMRTVPPLSGNAGYNQNPRASIIRLDNDTGTNELDRVPMPVARGSRDRYHPEHDELPAFTPGLFKDPIFEKGVALNLAAAAASASTAPTSSSGGHGGVSIGTGGVGGSPTSYSPATPLIAAHPTSEHARLIPSKQNSAGSAT